DLHIGGSESAINSLLPEGLLDPVEPIMLLPEVKDPKQWWGGHIWSDNAKRFIYSSMAQQSETVWRNTLLVKLEEIRSFDDLLAEKWKGKIGLLDPRTPGSGASLWSYLRDIKGEEYLRKLVGQKMLIGRDQRVLAENLARGKLALVMGRGYYSHAPFKKAGLPVQSIANSERRNLHQRRQRPSRGDETASASKRDACVRQLVPQQRRARCLFASSGTGDAPLGCRYSVASRNWCHRSQRQRHHRAILQTGKSVRG